MKTMLVTGGAGFIGSNFILYILKKHEDYRVINLDKLTYAGNLMNLDSVKDHTNYQFIHGDICDSSLVNHIFDENDIEFIVNFAAESHVDRSILEPELFVRTNVLGTCTLLNAAKEHWVGRDCIREKKFLQVSTDEVYGSLGETGYFIESTPLDPNSPYSSSKAGADMLVMAYCRTFGIPVNITRCSNNYGPRQFPEKLIPLMINNALNKKMLPVYGNGLNIRDWLFVDDHCRALDLVLHNAPNGEIYNIGGHNEKKNIEIVKDIIGFLGSYIDSSIDETLIKFVEDRKGHDKRYGIDPSKIANELGWSPEVSFKEGLETTVKWYIDNCEWVQNVTSGEYQEYYRKMYERDAV